MKICQHKDISPAQHLKIPLLDAYTLTLNSEWIEPFEWVGMLRFRQATTIAVLIKILHYFLKILFTLHFHDVLKLEAKVIF